MDHVEFPSSTFTDAARCNQVLYKFISDIQGQVLAGIHGGRIGYEKPFEDLAIQQVRQVWQELAARRLDSG